MIKNDLTMKTNCQRMGMLALAAGGIALLAGCAVEPNGQVVVGLPVVTFAPVVAVDAEPVLVPDTYVWDGYENVGMVGGAYFYLGPGNVWLACDGYRMDRFHGWAGGHPGWEGHGIRNDRYRTDHYGHVQQRRNGPGRPAQKRQEDHH